MGILLNYVNNVSYFMVESMSLVYSVSLEWRVQIVISNGIAFISNIADVMMGNKLYIMKDIENISNLKTKENENFKILINNYILKEYYVFNNTANGRILKENEFTFFIKTLLLNLEILLIGSQKLIYEYVNYFTHLFNWYNNFKILIDKSIINTNIKEELYYNISLELLSDIQNEYNKSLWWTIHHFKILDKDVYIHIMKNYFKTFKQNPYRISINLINLYKEYPQINLLSYGLNYDINISTHNKYIISGLNTDILSSRNNFLNGENQIKNIDQKQYFISKDGSVLTSSMKKRIIRKQDLVFRNRIQTFIDRDWENSENYIQKTFTLRRLRLLNNKYFNFQFLNDSILVYPWSNFNLKLDIYRPSNWSWNGWTPTFEKWTLVKTIYQPDRFFRFIQSIARYLAGTKEHVVYPHKISQIIKGKAEFLKMKSISDLDNMWISKDTKESALNLHRLRKLYGGYTYWWAWHQDRNYIYNDLNLTRREFKQLYYSPKLPKKINRLIAGYYGIFYATPMIIDVKLNMENFWENIGKFKVAALTKDGLNPNVGASEIERQIEEIEEMYKPNSDYLRRVKEFKEFKARGNKFAPKKIALEDINFDDVMYDTTLDEAKGIVKVKDKFRKTFLRQKFENIYVNAFNKTFSKESKEYEQALEMRRIRAEKDPLGILARYNKQVYKINFLTTMPEITTKKAVVNKNRLPQAYLPALKFKTELGEKTWKFLKRRNVRKYYGKPVFRDIEWSRFGGLKWFYIKGYEEFHGNIAMNFTRKSFKTFLVSNDVWLKLDFLKKKELIKKFKPAPKKVRFDLMYTGVVIKKPSVSKIFGKFVKVENLVNYYKNYENYANSQLKPNILDNVYYRNWLFYKKKYMYLARGNVWDKNWIQEAKNVASPDVLAKAPKKLKILKNFKRFRHQDLIQMTIKYNTPIRYKKVPVSWYTMVNYKRRGDTDLRYYVLNKMFEYYFYPEVSKKLKKVPLKHGDIIFELNISKKDLILKKLSEGTKYNYDVKMKYNVYKTLIRRHFEKRLLNSKNMAFSSFKIMRGFLMHKFSLNLWSNTSYLASMDYIRKNSAMWESFYYTNIESITEPLNLNIIHKNFYGKHLKDGFNRFLQADANLITDKVLPNKRSFLIKKAYIKNLIYVYEKEDKPIINYILYIIKKEEIKIIHKFVINTIYFIWEDVSNFLIKVLNFYKLIAEFFLELIQQELLKFREARRLRNYLNQHPQYITNMIIYMIIATLFFIYTIICIFLILIIKTFLPKNLIYGKLFNKDIKNNVDLYHKTNDDIENIRFKNTENFIKTISELEEIMEIDFNRDLIHNQIRRQQKKNIKNIDINDITSDYLRKLELSAQLKKNKKLYIKKNFFDPEQKYVYSWENKDFNLLEEIKKAKNSKKFIPLEDKRFLKKRIYINKFEENKINDLKEKYIVFYKNFIFEKNLEKWEDNTKRRLEFNFNKEEKGIVRLLLTDLWRAFLDRRFNHNRILFWDDPDVEDTSRINYMFAVYKPFFNIFFIIRFTLASLKLWDYNYWISKWNQYVRFGIHAKINYKDIRGRLEKEWSIEWYKDETDYGKIYFKDFIKIINKYEDIKKTPLNQEVVTHKKAREAILRKIIRLNLEEDKFKQIKHYLSHMEIIEQDRINGSFEDKFRNIALNLIVDIDKIGPHKWAEQELRYKYRNEVYKQKLKIEHEEYEVLKQSYTSRVKRDIDDKEKTLQTLHWRDDRKIKLIMQQKIDAIKYERSIREYNYHNKIIDAGLDAKEKVFYESIKKYNEELSEEYANIKEEEKKKILEENLYERKTRKLFGIIDENYIYFRWFTTMGARFNYLFVLIVGIFVGWWDNIKRIRKNEYSFTSLFLIMKTDLFKYIYKIYWEYLIIFNQNKAWKKLGFSIKEILKFAVILTPIFFYSTFLYSIFILYFLLFIVLVTLPKKIYVKVKEKIKKKIQKTIIQKIINIIKIVLNYFRFIWKIINFLFKDLDTGDTLWSQLYKKFYKFCAFMQYNIYMLKGAFILGYTNSNDKKIKNGLQSVFKWFKLKYAAYLEQKKEKKKNFSWLSLKRWMRKVHKIKIDWSFKLDFIIAILPFRFFLGRLFANFAHLANKMCKLVFNIEKDEFFKIARANIVLLKEYIDDIKELIFRLKGAKTKHIIILFFKIIWNILILPFKFIINHQKTKYIKNYKEGIQGFRDNPMYLIIDNPKRKNNWKVKLHKILMEQEISYYLREQLDLHNTLIDIFFMFKIHEVKWTNKNYYQDYFWRKWYWKYKKTKEFVLNFLIDLAVKIEENYASFEENIETKNWSLWERCKYAYYTYRLYKHGMSRKSQERKSRDIFFYNKAKDRRKIMRTYFIKGMINWLTYITINKVIFTKIRTKNIKYKYIKYKYKLKDIEKKIYLNSNNVHITEHLKNTPPQLWSLIIMYEIYYKTLLRYRYEDRNYPINWEENLDLELRKDYKWRLAAPQHIYEIPFYDRRFIAADINNFEFIDFVETLATEPYDPLLRWIIFLLEYGMAKEDLISAGNAIWLEGDDDEGVWADISLTHLLTFNNKLNEYKYEIKDFSRLIKGLDILKISEHSFQREKWKHYEMKFKEISEQILLENDYILKDILQERRKIRAKMLHKALARNRFKTKYELDEEAAKDQQREFFFKKKREFFEELLIEEFWDWQADYDEGAVEDRYFNSRDLASKTNDAHLFEEYFLATGKRLDYDYLLDHIVLKSFDQTMEEIHYFLTFKVWKILEKPLKKNKKKIMEINYKNLNLSNEMLSRINNNEHIVTRVRWHLNLKTGKEIPEEYNDYKYKKLEWESAKHEALYGFMESNILGEYLESGEFYTYETKIEFNDDAVKFKRPPKYFHGQVLLRNWLYTIIRRDKTLQNIRKKSIKRKRKLPLNIAYINNIKWTWEQWLIYADVDTENELLNKNTIILNERFYLWNLKRVPIRVKLPVSLTVDIDDMKDYIADKSNYMSFMDHRHMMMLSNIAPMLKQSLIWEDCKRMLEKKFDKNIQDLILWIFTAEALNREVTKIKHDYQFVLKNFVQNYGIFHKLYFLGMPQYTWDLIRYHQAWWGRDEFPYDRYYQLKQIEFLNHDPAAKRIVQSLYKLFLEKYSPVSFVYFFKYQYYTGFLYNVYGILSISALIWTIKVLMYNPGEYISENYMLFTPMLLTVAFWYLRRCLKTIRDIKQGGEIYLYRHRTSNVFSRSDLAGRKYRMEEKKKEWTEHFYDPDKIQELFPEGIHSISTDINPNWWRYHSHLNKYDAIYQYKHMLIWTGAAAIYFGASYWTDYGFKHRNSKWLWDYYRYDADLVKELREKGIIAESIRAPQSYKDRQWFIDSWTRLENGGNWYSRWYENYYRKRWGLPKKVLDYGHDWQKISNVDAAIVIEKNRYHFPGAVADVNWIRFSRLIESYNRLPDELKNFKEVIKLKFRQTRLQKRRARKFKIYERNWKRKKFKRIFEEVRLRRFERDKEITNWEILRDTLKSIKMEYIELFKKLYFRDRYITKFHPLKKWAEFLFWVQDNTGFDTTGNIYARFLLDAKKKTKVLIKTDLWRYKSQQDWEMQKLVDYVDLFKYIKSQQIKRNYDILVSKSRCFYKGEKMDIRALLSISEKEIHHASFRMFFLKSKQLVTWDKMQRKTKKYYVNDNVKELFINKCKMEIRKLNKDIESIYFMIERTTWILPKDLVAWTFGYSKKVKKINFLKFRLKQIKEIDKLKKIYANRVVKLKRYENYLKDLSKRPQVDERNEYRYNILVNLVKERKDLWIFIKDFFSEISLSDLFSVSIKVLSRIFE